MDVVNDSTAITVDVVNGSTAITVDMVNGSTPTSGDGTGAAPGRLASSFGRASRPGAGRTSLWQGLAYSERQDGQLIIDLTQPRTSGLNSGTPCATSEAECNGRPPADLSARLCRGPHDAGARAEIDLGPQAVLTSENAIYLWGWNSRCHVRCTFPDGRLYRPGSWQTNGHQHTGRYPIQPCAGARMLALSGGGHCGGCWVDGGRLSAQWAPAAVPPFPPGAAPTPPPPWPPVPASNVEDLAWFPFGLPLVLFGLLLACCVFSRRKRGRRPSSTLDDRRAAAYATRASREAPTTAPGRGRGEGGSAANLALGRAAARPPRAAPPPAIGQAVSVPSIELCEIVEGVPVVEVFGRAVPATALGASASPVAAAVAPTSPLTPTATVPARLTLAQRADRLRELLELEEGSLAETAARACRELGVATDGLSLAAQVDAALEIALGAAPRIVRP